MNINYEVLDKILLDLASVDDQVTVSCKEEINKFVISHNINDFSDDSLDQLRGIFRVSLNGVYEAMTNGQYLPNIFIRKGWGDNNGNQI